MKCLLDFGLGKGSVGAGACKDAEFLKNIEEVNLSEYLVAVPEVSASCIDERLDANGQRVQLAKTAGGPLSLVYALRLSGIARFKGMNELQLVNHVMDTLEEKGISHQFAVHDDDHEGCGCGACAKAHDVDNEIAQNFSKVSAAVKSLSSIDIDPVMQKQAAMMDAGFFADDRNKPLFLAQDDGAIIEDLIGDHDGSAIIINSAMGMTVDTGALRKTGIRAFVVDHWVFPALAEIFTENTKEQDLVVQALWTFNLATASVLCHQDIVAEAI